jgi:hypothetical protein
MNVEINIMDKREEGNLEELRLELKLRQKLTH